MYFWEKCGHPKIPLMGIWWQEWQNLLPPLYQIYTIKKHFKTYKLGNKTTKTWRIEGKNRIVGGASERDKPFIQICQKLQEWPITTMKKLQECCTTRKTKTNKQIVQLIFSTPIKNQLYNRCVLGNNMENKHENHQETSQTKAKLHF